MVLTTGALTPTYFNIYIVTKTCVNVFNHTTKLKQSNVYLIKLHLFTLSPLLGHANQIDVVFTHLKSAFDKLHHTSYYYSVYKPRKFGFLSPSSDISLPILKVVSFVFVTVMSCLSPTLRPPQGSFLGYIFFLITVDGITSVM